MPAFRRLSGAYAISRLGDFLAMVALAMAVYDRTHSTLATTALFLAFEFFPALLAPALTARLDRIPVARVLPALYSAEAVIFCALAALMDVFSLTPFLVLVAIDGALGVTARAICRAGVAGALGRADDLRAGNGLMNVAVAPAMAIGGALGGVLVAGAGVEVALLVNAATFAASALLTAGIGALPFVEADSGTAVVHWRARLDEALDYLRGNRVVLVLLAAQAAALVFFAMTEPIEVPYTRHTLGAGPGGYGALIATWGAGVVIGGLLYTWFGRQQLRAALLISTLVEGAAFLGLGAAQTITAACLIAVAGGAANGAQLSAIVTAIQESIAMEFQARVMSVYEAVTTATPGVGYVLGGALGAIAGGRVAFAVAGCGVFGVVALAAAARPWRIATAEPAPQAETLPA